MDTQVEPAAVAVRRWLQGGSDVVIRGDDGSGRSTVLQAVMNDAVSAGVHCVLVSAATVAGARPLTPLLLHALATGSRRPVGAADLVGLFEAELQGPSNLIFLDDADLLDAESVSVIEQVLRRTDARLVATTTTDLARSPAAVRGLVAERCPAEVRVRALGYQEMADLLSTVLGGSADAALISAVLIRSAGNPRVAVALARAGKVSGVLQDVDGLWTEVGALDTVPHDAVAHALGTRLDTAAIEALELLSWSGPLTMADAGALVGEPLLFQLAERARIAAHPTEAGTMLSVAPPALARALRNRLTAVRRLALSAQITARFGADFAPGGHEPAPWGDESDELAAPATRWDADLAGLVNERSAVQEAVRRAAWRENPTLAQALSFLRTVARPLPDVEIDELFATTDTTPTGPAERSVPLLAEFWAHQALWLAWRGDRDALAAHVARHVPELGAYGALLELIESWLSDDGANVVEALARIEPRLGELGGSFAQTWVTLIRAGSWIEEGRFDDVLDLVAGSLPHDHAWAAPYLAGARSDALLLLGRAQEAARWSRQCLEAAFDNLDPTGIRISAVGLGQALLFLDEGPAGWSMLNAALRLGVPGPLDHGYYQRLLALAAIVHAQPHGDLALAELLVRDVHHTSALSPRLPLDSVSAIAAASVGYARGENEASDELLWSSGCREAGAGHFASAALAWSARTGTYSSDQLRTIQAQLRDRPIPLLDPVLGLHAALVSGEETEILAAVRGSGRGWPPRHARTALNVIQALRRTRGREPLDHAEVVELFGADIAERLASAQRDDDATASELTDREREVALLARAGMSNRDIASRLFLSVRTVENHLYRALRKLGLERRAQLSTWEPLGTVPFQHPKTERSESPQSGRRR